MIVSAGIPGERAEIAVRAMRHGKDVMVDKPGVISADAARGRQAGAAETGRIWSVNFSERFEVRAMTRALELVAAGALGRVVQTVGFGPHRLNRHLRPAWFFDPAQGGGILADIASHQVDQFLVFTGSSEAEIVASAVANFANPETPAFQDFGEILLRERARERLCPGRLVHARRAFDLGRRPLHDPRHRRATSSSGNTSTSPAARAPITCSWSTARRPATSTASDAPLPYYERLIADVFARTETAMPQAHCFKVCELALQAQAQARRLA